MIRIDAREFRSIVEVVSGGMREKRPLLERGEAHAIVALAYLAVEADLNEESEEYAARMPLDKQVYELAGESVGSIPEVPVSPLPIDNEERIGRIREFAQQLSSTTSIELAYMICYVVIVADFQLSPVESRFLEELRRAVGLSEDRAAELASGVAEIITPPTE